MRPSGYFDLCRARLKAHPFHELLAAAGIAVGVALALAVLVANSSISRSSEEIVRGVTGTADFQIQARDSTGFDAQPLLVRVQALPDVDRAAALLDQRAVISRGGRSVTINLVAIDADVAALSGRLTRSFVSGALSLSRGIVLPASTAALVGIGEAQGSTPQALPSVRVEVRGRAAQVPVAAVFGADMLGPISEARAGLVAVERLREIAGLPGRASRILVDAAPGKEREVRRSLQRLAGDRLNVSDIDSEPRMLREALRPTGQATSFFAITAALLGFLLAFNAVLLTAPERRRWLADLITIHGAPPSTVVLLVIVQSLLLGIVGSAGGVVLGLLLANGILREDPTYLAPAFTLGGGSVVTAVPLLISVGGGLLACLLAATPLLLDLRPGRSLEAIYDTVEEPGQALRATTTLKLLAGALALVLGALAILRWAPAAALLACGLLAIATVLAVPATFVIVVGAVSSLERRSQNLVLLSTAVRELRATTLRSLALASTGAIAVFGSVAIGGARHDLLRGIQAYVSDYVDTAGLWITHSADNQATNAFALTPTTLTAIHDIPGVAGVRTYFGSFLDVGDRRVWIIARDAADPAIVPPSQLRDGTARSADARIRTGGWAAVSDQLIDAIATPGGDRVTLPTPTGPRQLRVAATISNLGWSPGALVMNATDYRHWWKTTDPSAIQIDLQPGAALATIAPRIQTILDASGLEGTHVISASARAATINRSASSGLSRLGQISVLLVLSACLAMAAALGAAIWQRRPRLAESALIGMRPFDLWRALMLECAIIVGTGCLIGAALGILGQVVIDRYLTGVTGYPLEIAIGAWPAITTVALVIASAIAVVAVPGWFAARVGAEMAFDED